MPGLVLSQLSSDRRLLIAAAAPSEGAAILRGLGHVRATAPEIDWTPIEAGERIDLVVTGVGKANAAGGVARAFDPGRHGAVLSLGLAGALPGTPPLGLLTVVAGTISIYGDEGVPTADGGFKDLAMLGFAPNSGLDDPSAMGVASDAALLAAFDLRELSVGAIATVSECSGTDERAAEMVRRTGAVAEAMEGAAVGFTVRRVSRQVRFLELRVISNTTGDRDRQVWDVRGALGVLSEVAGLL